MSVFAQRITSCSGLSREENSIADKPSTVPFDRLSDVTNPPRWFSLRSSIHPAARQLWRDLHSAGYGLNTPVYLEGIRFDNIAGSLLRKLYDSGALVEIVDGVHAEEEEDDEHGENEGGPGIVLHGTGVNGDIHRFPKESPLPRDPLNNPRERYLRGKGSPSRIQLPPREALHEVFMYAGDKYSGTFLHQHGSACTMMSSDTRGVTSRLWILYSPEQYCNLNKSLPSHFPSRCPSGDGNCIESLHPLDALQHYWELEAYGPASKPTSSSPRRYFAFRGILSRCSEFGSS